MANYFYDLPEELIVLIYSFINKETLTELEQMREVFDNRVGFTQSRYFENKLVFNEFKLPQWKIAEQFCPLLKYTECALKDYKVLKIWVNHFPENQRVSWLENTTFGVYRYQPEASYLKFPYGATKDEMVEFLTENDQKAFKSWKRDRLVKACLAF